MKKLPEKLTSSTFFDCPKPRYLVISQIENETFPLILKSQFREVLQLFRNNNHGFTVKDLRNLLDEVINEN